MEQNPHSKQGKRKNIRGPAILWGNVPNDFTNLTAAAFDHCRADKLTPGVGGNIIADPLFIDPAAGNYGLRTLHGQYVTLDGDTERYGATSPCIDAGYNRDWMGDAMDLRGFPRLAHGLPISGGQPRVDMGVYEVTIPPSGGLFLVR